jgi:transposase
VFLAAIAKKFENATQTVDWFHVVQLFTRAVDEVRKAEHKVVKLPEAIRWAVLKAWNGGRLTDKQTATLVELEAGDFFTAEAWRIKEKLRWVRAAEMRQAAKWRMTHFLRHPVRRSMMIRCSRNCATRSRPLTNNKNASWNAGHQPTAMPAWKPSTASSKQPGQGLGGTEMWPPS